MHFVNSRNKFLHAINDKHLTNHFTQITYFLKSTQYITLKDLFQQIIWSALHICTFI